MARNYFDFRSRFYRYHVYFGFCELMNLVMVLFSVIITDALLLGKFWKWVLCFNTTNLFPPCSYLCPYVIRTAPPHPWLNIWPLSSLRHAADRRSQPFFVACNTPLRILNFFINEGLTTTSSRNYLVINIVYLVMAEKCCPSSGLSSISGRTASGSLTTPCVNSSPQR